MGGLDRRLGFARTRLVYACVNIARRRVVAGGRLVARRRHPLAADEEIVGRNSVDHLERCCAQKSLLKAERLHGRTAPPIAACASPEPTGFNNGLKAPS